MLLQHELIERCKANDRQAQLQLYKKYCQGMYAVAMRFLQNEDDAEDVLQEAFIKAFQRLDQFRGDVTFGAWLKRIVVNGCIDFLKSKKTPFVALEDKYIVQTNETRPMGAGIKLEVVKEAIARLSEAYRFVVQLFLVEGYDHQEIAQILQISESASRTRLMRGKSALQETLRQMQYGRRS
ncbi:MAG: RNA polymerase sigma factor [Bacteroidota bacterium]